MKLITKKNSITTTINILDDIVYSYETLIHKNEGKPLKNKVYIITLTDTHLSNPKSLNFLLTNCVFNQLHQSNRESTLNYLFVIEYDEVLSKGEYMVRDKIKIHSHIVIATNIEKDIIEDKIRKTIKEKGKINLRKQDVFIQDITNNKGRFNYYNYLIKQKELLTTDNYNYKIDINRN